MTLVQHKRHMQFLTSAPLQILGGRKLAVSPNPAFASPCLMSDYTGA